MSLTCQDQLCPLCLGADRAESYYRGNGRDYFQCRTCQLVYVPSDQFLSAVDEKAAYDLHQNSPDDPRYRQFLSRLFVPMQSRLSPGSRGLDFGSGPGPTLSVMFEEAGHPMSIYDRFYARDPSVLKQPYDFITATEVLEHLHQPRQELDRLWDLLKPGGSLGIMTKLVRDRAAFARWHYKNDLTHVRFFSRPTFEWLAGQWYAELAFAGDDVVLFAKRS